MTRNLKKYFWLALLAHVLLFLSGSLRLVFEPNPVFEKKSERYLPVYLQQEASTARAATPSTPPTASHPKIMPQTQDTRADQISLKKQQPTLRPAHLAHSPSFHSAAFIPAESLESGKPHDEPLLKELSRATAAKLYYPPEAAAFRITGTVTIRFLLYPDGRVTEVIIAKSSGFHLLDEAALNTIRAISPVRDANLYLNKPRYLLAGIIFG